MSDDKYLINYCKAFWTIFEHSNDLVYVKDADFRFCSISNEFLKLIGIEERKTIIGKSALDIDVTSERINFSKLFTEQDLQVKLKRMNRIFLDVMNYPDGIHTMIVCKTPIINPETNNFVGIRGHIGHLINPNIIKTLLKLHEVKGLLVNHNNNKKDFYKYQLNEMQHMVLYLCINNYSYSEIAMLLSAFGFEITPTRVNDYIDQLKIIFRVSTKTQLTEKAIGLDLHTYLPAGLLKVGSLDISEQSISVV